jgi:predicted MPP superfamily phosphohydrolase
MQPYELIGIVTFAVFWWLVYSFEIKYLISFFRKKVFRFSGFAIIIHVLAITGIACLIYGYFVEPYWVDVRHVEIKTGKLKETELTIVQISDLHCDEKIRNENTLPEIINALSPDVIVFTGDSLNTPRALPIFKKMMSAMKAKNGKYAVRGNFDVWYWKEIDLFGETGFVELDGQTVTLSKGHEKFTLSGLSANNSSAASSFLNSLPPDTYNILLFHYPGINEELGEIGIDLFLSGHTHGGQVALPFYGAVVTFSKYGKKYESGRYDLTGKVLYVNRGIGMEGGIAPRLRFLARPEITVLHIKPKDN